MKRKINRVGQNTHTVSLPSKWVKLHNLKPGDEMELIEEKDGMKLIPEFVEKVEEVNEVVVKKPQRLVNRQLFNLYRRGANAIKIKFDDPIVIKDINKAMQLMMGFEITSEGADFAVLKNVLKIDEESFNESFRRLFLVTLNLAEDSYDAIKKKEYGRLEGIGEREFVQNRLYMYCSRIINKKGYAMFDKPNLQYLLVQRLEDIGDDYKYVCRYLIEKNTVKVSPKVLGVFNEVNGLLRRVYELYYSFSIDKSEEIIIKKKILIKELFLLLETVPREEVRIVHILLNVLVKIYEASSPIYGLHM